MAKTHESKSDTANQIKGQVGDTGAEQRKHKRVDFFNPVKVVVPEENLSLDVFATNVSKGGMFIRSNQPLSPRKKIKLSFSTEKGSVHVDEAEVRWSKRFEPISVDGSPPGMGIEFQRISDDSTENIAAFIDEVLGDEAGPAKTKQAKEPGTEPSLPMAPSLASSQQSSASFVADTNDLEPEQSKPEASNRTNEQILSTQTSAPTPTQEWDNGSEEDMAAAFSTPPAPRTRAILFVGFVLIVAILTFLTLMWLKPFGQGAKKTTLSPPRHDHGKLSPITNEAAKPKLNDKSKTSKSFVKNKDQMDKTPDSAVAKTTKTDTHHQSSSENHDKVTASSTTTMATQKDKSVEQQKNKTPKIYSPVFSKTANGWQMSISADNTIHSKYFSLKAPARLAIDITGARWSGQSLLDKPAPFVSRIRIGKQPDSVRFVLDFKTTRVPKYRIKKMGKGLMVLFTDIK